MVQVPAPDGGTFCIDSTEVTQAQYAAFLAAKNGDTSGQSSECSWNTSFAAYSPPDVDAGEIPYDPSSYGSYPAEVDWCDAVAFCQWAGKSLCAVGIQGGVDGGVSVNWSDDQWIWACTGGNTYPSLNADGGADCVNPDVEPDGGAVPDNGYLLQSVNSDSACQSSNKAFGGIFDQLGNVSEWVDYCADGLNGTSPGEQCIFLGRYGRPCLPYPNRDMLVGQNVTQMDAGGPGIRCCTP
jgi:formylglycine-generating enzyme